MIRHMRIEVSGAIKNPQMWVDCITVEGKLLTTEAEVKAFFADQLAQGNNYLPMGDCEGFDFVTGTCPGHEEV